MSEYRNPWHSVSGYDPAIYRTEAKPVEHRGYTLFNRVPGVVCDIVKDGVCLGQFVTVAGAKGAVDLMIEHGHPDAHCLRAECDR